jgi:hypothetical protein
MARDARENPVESIRTAIKLRDIGRSSPPRDTEVRAEIEGALAVVVRNAVWGLRGSGANAQAILFALRDLAESPLGAASALDTVFQRLVKEDAEAVRGCWSGFIARQSAGVGAHSFRELFPLTYGELGHDEVQSWLLKMLVDRQPEARRAAAALLRGERGISEFGLGFGPQAFEGLTAAEAEALPWAAVANGLGEAGVELVAGAAVSCLPARAAAVEALLNVYRHVYPGKVRTFAGRWAEGDDAELVGAAGTILEAVERWGNARAASVSCPDIGLTLQTEPIAGELENNALRRQMAQERGSGRWPFWSLATKIPVSRGGASVHSPDAQASAFKSVSFTGEYAFRTRVDPLGAALAVAHAEERLRNLLGRQS